MSVLDPIFLQGCHFRGIFFSVLGKFPPVNSPSPPRQTHPNLTLTQTLTLTQVEIHRREIDQRGIFRTPFLSYLNIAVPYNFFNFL